MKWSTLAITAWILLLPAISQADPLAMGELLGVVFDADHAPLSGVGISVAGERRETGPDGTFRVRLAPGAHALKVLAGPESFEIAVTIFSGEQTQVLVTLGDPVTVEIEAAESGIAANRALRGLSRAPWAGWWVGH